jgi:hypothetical protein
MNTQTTQELERPPAPPAAPPAAPPTTPPATPPATPPPSPLPASYPLIRDDIVVPTRPQRRPTSIVFPVLLVGAGVLLLLNTMNVIDWNVWDNVWRLWPLIPIAIGLEILFGRRSAIASTLIAVALLAGLLLGIWFWAGQPLSGQAITSDTISQTMQGAKQANVTIDLGIGTFQLGSLSSSDQLVSGRVGHTGNETVRQDFNVSGDTAYYTLKTESNWAFPFTNIGRGDLVWDLSLNSQVPIDLNVNSGLGDSTLDLQGLNLTHLNLSGGAGNTTVTLPAHGTFGARINGGLGNLNVNVPQGMEVRVTGSMGLGNREMPDGYIQAGKAYESPGYATARERIDLDLNGGLGNVTMSVVQPETTRLP